MGIIAWLILGLIAGFIGSKIVNKSGETYYERVAMTSSPYQGTKVSDAPSFEPSFSLQSLFLDLLNGVSGGHKHFIA